MSVSISLTSVSKPDVPLVAVNNCQCLDESAFENLFDNLIPLTQLISDLTFIPDSNGFLNSLATDSCQ